MESNMIKIKNPDTNHPTNIGKKWMPEEDTILLEELDKNINIKIIAQNHHRTVGGIRGRQETIAYNMYLKKDSIEEIIKITKLDKEQILRKITQKQTILKNIEINTEPITETKKKLVRNEIIEMRDEINELRNEIIEMRNIVKELVETTKVV